MPFHIPDKLGFLYKPARFKVLYGGRGGAKSQGCAEALLVDGIKEPLSILCAREFQSSIRDSVHSLLRISIDKHNLGSFYTVQDQKIIGKNGTQFIFAGLRHNINNIKSIPDIDRVWIEEADTVSEHTWSVLLPTIRKKGSEIWITFNPVLETDPTYKRFVLNPPSDAIVVKINWRDNPWFYDTELPSLKDQDELNNPDQFLHVWEGHCKQTIEGAVYASEIRALTASGRICRVPRVPGVAVDTFWDLGKRDQTSVWFCQFFQGQYRIIDFYQCRGKDLPHYLLMLQEKQYLYGIHHLPHDATQDRLGSVTIEKQFKSAYPDKVKVLPRILKVEAGIEATRHLFPLCWFDEEKCVDGLQALRRYKYKVDENTGSWSKEPLHDENSDASDGFRQIAQAMVLKGPKPQTKKIFLSKHGGVSGNGWMSK